MPLPVFVVGRNRSGTTWLANQLCEHPDIVGVQHERHHGIHESAYFGLIDGRFGASGRVGRQVLTYPPGPARHPAWARPRPPTPPEEPARASRPRPKPREGVRSRDRKVMPV